MPLQAVPVVVAEAGGSTRISGTCKSGVRSQRWQKMQIKLAVSLFLPCSEGPTSSIARNGVVWAAVARKRGVVFMSRLKLSRREKRIMHHRVGSLASQKNATSIAHERERHTWCSRTLCPDSITIAVTSGDFIMDDIYTTPFSSYGIGRGFILTRLRRTARLRPSKPTYQVPAGMSTESP